MTGPDRGQLCRPSRKTGEREGKEKDGLSYQTVKDHQKVRNNETVCLILFGNPLPTQSDTDVSVFSRSVMKEFLETTKMVLHDKEKTRITLVLFEIRVFDLLNTSSE